MGKEGAEMAEINETWKSVRQNLIDAGCDGKTEDFCMKCLQDGRAAKMLPALEAHRRTLLDALHCAQKRIDCLDYLIFRIRQSKEKQTQTEPKKG